MIFGTSCDRGRFSVVVGTIWLQYGPSGCSRDYFRGCTPPPRFAHKIIPITAASLDGLTKKNGGGWVRTMEGIEMI